MPARITKSFTTRLSSALLKCLFLAEITLSTALCHESAPIDQAASNQTEESSGEKLDLILQSLKEIKNLSVPLGNPSAQPVLVFSCERILLERKKIGFFRIGILPQIILQNVNIKLWNTPTPADWTGELAGFLVSKKISDMEIRTLRIESRDGASYILAEKAAIRREEESLILHEVVVELGKTTLHQKCAVIPLRRGRSGVLVFPEKPNFRLTITDRGIEDSRLGQQ